MKENLGKKRKNINNKDIKTNEQNKNKNESNLQLPYFANQTDDISAFEIESESTINQQKKKFIFKTVKYKNFIDEKIFHSKMKNENDEVIHLDDYFFYKKEKFLE